MKCCFVKVVRIVVGEGDYRATHHKEPHTPRIAVRWLLAWQLLPLVQL